MQADPIRRDDWESFTSPREVFGKMLIQLRQRIEVLSYIVNKSGITLNICKTNELRLAWKFKT